MSAKRKVLVIDIGGRATTIRTNWNLERDSLTLYVKDQAKRNVESIYQLKPKDRTIELALEKIK